MAKSNKNCGSHCQEPFLHCECPDCHGRNHNILEGNDVSQSTDICGPHCGRSGQDQAGPYRHCKCVGCHNIPKITITERMSRRNMLPGRPGGKAQTGDGSMHGFL